MQACISATNDALVIRRREDKKIYKESTFFYELAKVLKSEYHLDMIRKEMAKDGHLVNDGIYYVRDRNKEFCYYDADANMRDICKAFNEGKQIVLIKGRLIDMDTLSKEKVDNIITKHAKSW